MDPITTMELHKGDFTKNDRQIYAHIMANLDQVSYQSTSKLAEACGVSQPALSRFVRTLGYERYQDFRSDMISWLAQQQVPSDPSRLFYFEQLERLMRAAEQTLTDGYLRELAAYVQSFNCILATGIGKSLEPAQLLQHLMRKNDVFVHVCTMDTLIEYVDHMESGDLLVVFSASANFEVMDLACGNSDGKVMLVTTNVSHAYQEKVDRTVVLPFLPPDPETCPVSPVLFDIFVELLVSYLTNGSSR